MADFGNVGSLAVPAIGDGAGAGGVSYLATVVAFALPLQALLRAPVAPAPAIAGETFSAPAGTTSFP